MARLNVAHVFIHYFSNKNRYSTKLFLSEPNRQVSEHLGSIFGIIEINTPSRENSKIIEQLIGEIETTYYGFASTQTPADKAFEQTLKHIDEFAVTLISKDPTYAHIGLDRASIKEKINVAIGVIKGKEILLTTINSVGAFLIHKTKQGYKLIEIAKQAGANNPNSLFESVISGEVADDDYLFFCNNDVMNFISKERVLKTLTSLSPVKAADYLKHSLLQHEGFNFAALIFQFEAEHSTAIQEPKSLTSIGVLNASARATEKLLSPSLLPNLAQIAKKTGSHIQTFIKEQFPANPKTSLRKEPRESNFSKHLIKETPSTLIPPVPPSSRQHTPSPITEGTKKVIKNLRQTFEYNLHALRLADRIKQSSSRIVEKINSIPNISKILIISFFLILGIFLTVTLAPHTQYSFITGSGISKELTELETTINEAESKLIYNDKENARTLIAQAQTALQNIKIQNNNEQQFANALSQKIDRLVSQLRNITLIEQATEIANLSGATTPDIKALLLQDKTLYAFDNANKTVSAFDTGSYTPSPIAGTFEGSIKSAKLDEHQSPFFITDTNKLYAIKGGKITPLALQLSPEDIVADFDFYNDRLYTLIPNKNQIYRHPSISGGYGAGITWIQQAGVNISNAVSFEIDASIWVLTSDGRVTNLFKGGIRSFALAPIEPPLTSAAALLKNPEETRIFVFDQQNNRIALFDTPAGNLLTQYYSPTIGAINSLAINDTANLAYVASGSKILQIPLTEPKPQE